MGYEERAEQKMARIRQSGRAVVLAIETSCDETAAAIVQNGRRVLGQALRTQMNEHALYGGVVPEIASRSHVETVWPVVAEALAGAGLRMDDLDCVAVTKGPGLVGALLAGLSFGKALAWGAGLPLVGVNHIEGHICANYVAHPALEPPFLCLVVSGGHTHLAWAEGYRTFRLLGRTLDDAAGEAFDKTARLLGLAYPGGPRLDALAERGDARAFAFTPPRTREAYDFSFSGLKTQVMQAVKRFEASGEALPAADLAASFRRVAVQTLVDKTLRAARETGARTVALAGGVAANRLLRERLEETGARMGLTVLAPPPALCTDNAVMIAGAGYFQLLEAGRDGLALNAQSNLALGAEAG